MAEPCPSSTGWACSEDVDSKPTFWNLAPVPILILVFSLAMPNITRRAPNIRRALKRYDAQPVRPVPEVEPKQHDGLKNFAVMCAHSALALAVCHYIFRQKDTVPILVGIALSNVRPFCGCLLVDRHFFVNRVVKAQDEGRRGRPQGNANAQLRSNRSQGNMLPAWAQATLFFVQPIFLGLLAAHTGLLLPTMLVSCKLYWVSAYLEFSASLYQILRFLIVNSTLVLTLGRALSHFDKPTNGEVKLPNATSKAQHSAGVKGSVAYVSACRMYTIALMFMPIVFIFAAACNFDLHNLEKKHGSLETVFETLQGESFPCEEEVGRIEIETDAGLPLVDDLVPQPAEGSHQQEKQEQQQQALVTSRISVAFGIDYNGKIPEPVIDEKALDARIRLGNPMIDVYAIRTGSSTDTTTATFEKIQKSEGRPVLELPTWTAGVNALQFLALSLILSALLISALENGRPLPAAMRWLHPISLGALLFDRRSWTRLAATARLNAVACVCMIVGLTAVVSAMLWSAWRQQGWKGVRTLWTLRNPLYSEAPSTNTAASADEADEAIKEVPPKPLV